VAGTTIGWFGKLPSHGDFLQRRMSDRLLGVWDAWLQQCIAVSRDRLGDAWLDTYLTSPIWRFHLCEGIAGSTSYAGVLLPSVDRVGRYFPLTIVAELPAALPPMATAIHGRAWFREIEALAMTALEDDRFDVESFDAAVRASAAELAQVDNYYAPDVGLDFPQGAAQWRLPMASSDRMPAALIDPLMHQLGRQLAPLSVWWTDGSEHVAASCLVSQGLPPGERFVAMLDGRWDLAGWAGDFSTTPTEAEPIRYRVASAAISETGPVRETNQDRVLARPDAGLWVVADGMGGHSRGEYASQLIVDVLNSVEPAATLAGALASVNEGLVRANRDLIRAALQMHYERSGSTVVTLSIRQGEWGVLWAGDSRAYLLRESALVVLTRDHAVSVEHGDFDPAAPPMSTGEITRAIGGHDVLELDRATGSIHIGDRFLLTSDGIHGVMPHEEIASVLRDEHDARLAAQRLLARALELGSKDNISVVIVDVLADDSADA
jgi:type VI secretion system protein ImpM